ncbi:MAG: PH domain-containing protein [Verrucomicrobiota bacterium]
MKHYKAPWCKALIVVSILATLLCFGIAFGTPLLNGPRHHDKIGMWLRWLPLALVPVCALFTIRGYSITPGEILIHRLLWSTRLPRTGLQSAIFDPSAMCKSIRTCGNGGLYSITGWYWNKTLKSYRAYVTDPKLTVVLRYENRRIVVSPENPEAFVSELMAG